MDAEVGREHRGLCVLCLFEFEFCIFLLILGQVLSKHEGGQSFTFENFNHGLIRFIPSLSNTTIPFGEVKGHTDILATLPWIELSNLGLFGQWCSVGNHDHLFGEEIPFRTIFNRLLK